MFSKDADFSSKNKLPELTPGSKALQNWGTDQDLEFGVNPNDDNNSDFAEEIRKNDMMEARQQEENDNAIKLFEKEMFEDATPTPVEHSQDEKIKEIATNLLLENIKGLSPSQTFNFPKGGASRNQVESKLLIKGTNKEIMGNSWINCADTEKITTLKRERSKLDIAELEREIADLEAPLSVIDERPKDSTTNVGSSEFKYGIATIRDKAKRNKADDEMSMSDSSKFAESSFIGNHSLSSLAKPWRSNPGSLSISDISQIQRENNL